MFLLYYLKILIILIITNYLIANYLQNILKNIKKIKLIN